MNEQEKILIAAMYHNVKGTSSLTQIILRVCLVWSMT